MKKHILILLLCVITALSLKAQTVWDVTTYAGSGVSASKDGTASDASFNDIEGICSDASGNIYVSEKGHNNIRKISVTGNVTTFAGPGAHLVLPAGLCADRAGNIYVAESRAV